MRTTRPHGHGDGIEVTFAHIPLKMLLTLATETWRVRRKLLRIRDTDEVAGLLVSTERMESCFREAFIECRDYDNQPHDDGLNVRVLNYEERDGLAPGSELIVQTVTPGIFVNGKLVRQGEVVVARGVNRKEEADYAEHS